MVHMEPRAVAGEHLFDRIRVIAARRGLSIHELSAHHLDGRLFIEMHLEVPEQLSLRDAHRRASDLDRKSTRLNSSHQIISYAVFCLKKKKKDISKPLPLHCDLGKGISTRTSVM